MSSKYSCLYNCSPIFFQGTHCMFRWLHALQPTAQQEKQMKTCFCVEFSLFTSSLVCHLIWLSLITYIVYRVAKQLWSSYRHVSLYNPLYKIVIETLCAYNRFKKASHITIKVICLFIFIILHFWVGNKSCRLPTYISSEKTTWATNICSSYGKKVTGIPHLFTHTFTHIHAKKKVPHTRMFKYKL